MVNSESSIKSKTPAFVMGGRLNASTTESSTPGPGSYAASSDPSRPKSPAFTMSGRSSNERVSSDAPGPGSYDPRFIFSKLKYITKFLYTVRPLLSQNRQLL